MQELRFVAVSEDGSYAVLAVPGRSARFTLPIDERLRAVALGHTSRLAQYEIEVESPLRPKEIQARIRAGETVEQIADAAGIPVERVRWFEGPVLAERAYIADQAQSGSVRRQGESTPGPRLGEIVTERLQSAGIDPGEAEWDSRKRADGSWQVALTFPSGGRLHTAEWIFDSRRRHVSPSDDNASRLSLPEEEFTPPPLNAPGEATVTPLAPRLGATAAGGGGSAVGQSGASGQASAAASASSRFRHERPSAPSAPSAPPPAPAPAPREPAASFSPTPPVAQAPSAPRADASSASPIVEPEPEPEPAPAPVAAAKPEPTPVATPEPEPEPAPAPKPVAAAVVTEPEPVAAAPVAAPEPAAAIQEAPAVREPAPDVAPQPVPEQPAAAAAESPAAKHEPAPAQPSAKPGSAGRQGSRKAKNRRSSVPSWDEIMLGSSREQE